MGVELMDYETHILEELQDPEFLEGYLNEVLKEGDLPTLLVALKYIAKAKCGSIAALSEKSGYSRQTLYNTLSKNGNPTIKNLNMLLKTVGFRLQVEAVNPKSRKKR